MLTIYNSLNRQIEEFKPIDPKSKLVTMYNCGPTVYNYCHIGNFRSFLMADLLRRTLELNGFKVRQIMNITDVGHMTDDAGLSDAGEDKMATALKKSQEETTTAKKEGKFDGGKTPFKSPWEVASFYTKAFFEDMDRLNLLKPEAFPKASDHIPEMITIVEDLMQKGIAYKANDGTVYFDIAKFPNYGQLSNNTLNDLQAGAGGRILEEELAGKRSPHDFSLWKLDDKHIMKWETSLGTGFPGWHIECSAMSMKFLGPQMDFHTGGEDNRFPHHECEIAQSEAHTGKQFVNYWLHAKHLMVDGQKMSKSAGTFFTVRELCERGYHPLAIRWALMSAHFLSPLNFSLENIDIAQKNIEKLVAIKEKLTGFSNSKNPDQPGFQKYSLDIRKEFKETLNANLNLPGAQGVAFKFVSHLNQIDCLSQSDAKSGLETLATFDSILGVIDNYTPITKEAALSESEILDAINSRKEARKNKDFAEGDRIRDWLKEHGIDIKDGPTGTTWKTL
ncbi:MAG: cysteine--tRNA ligase [Zetaproteobacteria bacterium]|nr:cysteine--tRNA ligase [Pseudobdellovibrionaceae bacterium]